MLSKEISKVEIIKAIQSLKNEKSLGVDGLFVEFYKKNCQCIIEDLL